MDYRFKAEPSAKAQAQSFAMVLEAMQLSRELPTEYLQRVSRLRDHYLFREDQVSSAWLDKLTNIFESNAFATSA